MERRVAWRVWAGCARGERRRSNRPGNQYGRRPADPWPPRPAPRPTPARRGTRRDATHAARRIPNITLVPTFLMTILDYATLVISFWYILVDYLRLCNITYRLLTYYFVKVFFSWMCVKKLKGKRKRLYFYCGALRLLTVGSHSSSCHAVIGKSLLIARCLGWNSICLFSFLLQFLIYFYAHACNCK